ncbi:MAG: hypothetical protein IK115_11710 [Lachnospiraceae bacterium]|nr:hypothetical protein [Lachnospiraceae bacterium]
MDNNNMNQYQQPNQQMYQQQAPYQQPYQEMYVGAETETPVSVGDWVLTILLMCIPCVNFVLLFVWAFGSNTAKSKSNWAKATLIWILIAIVLEVILFAVMGAAMMEAFRQIGYSF